MTTEKRVVQIVQLSVSVSGCQTGLRNCSCIVPLVVVADTSNSLVELVELLSESVSSLVLRIDKSRALNLTISVKMNGTNECALTYTG